MEPKDLLVAGFSLAGFIVLVVQALKVGGVGEEWIARAPWITALVFLALSAVEQTVPGSEVYIQAVLTAIVGAASAVVGYFYALKPLAQKFGAKVSVDDLEE